MTLLRGNKLKGMKNIYDMAEGETHEEREARLAKAVKPGRPRLNRPPPAQLNVTYALLVKVYRALAQALKTTTDDRTEDRIRDSMAALLERTGGHVAKATLPDEPGRWSTHQGSPRTYRMTWPSGKITETAELSEAAEMIGVGQGTLRSAISNGRGKYARKIYYELEHGGIREGWATCELTEDGTNDA